MADEMKATADIPEVSKECFDAIDKFLTLSDGEFKRLSFDGYNAQLANARSYMWLATTLLTAIVLFARATGMPEIILEKQVLPGLIGLGLLASAACAVGAFFLASAVCHNSDTHAYLKTTAKIFKPSEEGGTSREDIYEERRFLLNECNRATAVAAQYIQKRGRKLRLTGQLIQASMASGLFALGFYALFWFLR